MNYVTLTCLSLVCVRIKCDDYYTEKDFGVIGALSEFFHSPNLVFVSDGGDVGLFRQCRKYLGERFYSAAFDSSTLEKILRSDALQARFFQKRSVLITKEKLNLTELLGEVLLPHYLTWIIFNDNGVRDKVYIPASSNVLFVNSTTESVSVEQVYHLKRGHEPVKISWSLQVPDSISKLSRVKEKLFRPKWTKINFKNVTLDLHVLHTREECLKKEGTMMKKLSCIHQSLLMLMGDRLNYSLNFVECQNKEYPYTYPNGTDSEIFEKLKNREVDFSSPSQLVKWIQRRTFMDYIWPTFSLKSMMYLKQVRLAGRWVSYLKPLESSVWWCILSCIIITGILMNVFEKSLTNSLKFDWTIVYELVMSVFGALQVFCNQAGVNLSTSFSIRIIYFLNFFVVLIFFQAYCGYLVSSLTVVVSRFPFTDLNGFYENGEYQLMSIRKGFHRYYFKKVVLNEYNENLMLPDDDLPETIQEAVDKLCARENLAFVEFREDLLNFGSLSCKISELPSPLFHLYFGFGIPRKTPLKEYLNRELLHLRSTGITHRMGSRISINSDFRDGGTSNEFPRVSIMHVFSVFILLHVGIALSVMIFCMEMLLRRKPQRSTVPEKRKLRLHHERIICETLRHSFPR